MKSGTCVVAEVIRVSGLKAGRKYHYRNATFEKSSDAGKFYVKMLRDIEADLGGHTKLSRIEQELAAAFAGSATALRYLTHQVTRGEIEDLDLTGYATIASTVLRIGAKLGLSRRARKVEQSLDDVLDEYRELPADAAE